MLREYVPSVNTRPLRLAIVNDYEVVVNGLARQLARHPDRVVLVDLAVDEPSTVPADIALFDTFAHLRGLAQVLEECNAQRLVAYSWNLNRSLIESMLDHGASGYLSKQLDNASLLSALERIDSGEVVVTYDETDVAPHSDAVGAWPGRSVGLTERESEIIALVAQGLSNAEVAGRLYLSINTVKSYIRSAYRRMRVRSRAEAVLWAVDHDFVPGHLGLAGAHGDVLEAVRSHPAAGHPRWVQRV